MEGGTVKSARNTPFGARKHPFFSLFSHFSGQVPPDLLLETVVGASKPPDLLETAQMTLFRPFPLILAIPGILARSPLFPYGNIDFCTRFLLNELFS